MSRRAVVVAALVASLAWAIGFGAYAVQVRNGQAQVMGMSAEDRCLSETHDGGHCFDVREEAEEETKSGFPIGNVAMVIGIPITVLWIIVWFVVRRKRRIMSSEVT